MVAEAGTIEIVDIERSGLNPLNDVRGAATIKTGGNRLFATSSETQDRFSIFTVDPDTGFTFADGATADGAFGLTLTKVGGQTFLIGAGRANDTIYSYEVSSSGILTLADSQADAGALNLDDQQSAPAVIEVGGTTFVVQSGFADDGISVFSLDSTGTLLNTFNFDDGDAPSGTDFALDGVQAVTAFEAHGQTFVAAAGNLADGIGLFELNAAGQLSFSDSMFDSDADASGLQAPVSMTHATIGNRTFLFTASDGLDGISSVEVKDDGSLKHQSNYFDANFTGESMDMTVVQMSGLTFLLATDRSFGTVTAFHVDAAGRIQRIAQLTDTADAGSAHLGAFGVAGFAEDQRLFAMVSAQTEDAISLFEVGALNDSIIGSSGDDILIGFGGDDDLDGQGGDDTLYGLANRDRMDGGTGDDALYGGMGKDDLRGSNGKDRLEGGAGIDNLYGGSENDTVYGNAGTDILRGGKGGDDLIGGNGGDEIKGQRGADAIYGGLGDDLLTGGMGKDRLGGGRQDDVLKGGDQADLLYGGRGDDALAGGTGDDFLGGGGGDDRLNGGIGNDVLVGNGGADRFQFYSFRNGERDVIRDFEDGVDLIDIKDDVAYLKQQMGDDLLVTFDGSGHRIYFHDLDVGDLTRDDFV